MQNARRPIQGPAAWNGADLERSGDWISTLNDTHRREIAAALERVKNRPLFTFGRAEFPLFTTADLLGEIGEELENGRGMVRLRGLPVERYSEDELRQIFWGIGCHLGTAVYQNATGEIMGEVRDETRMQKPSFEKIEPG